MAGVTLNLSVRPHMELIRNTLALPMRLRLRWRNRRRHAASASLQQTLKDNHDKAVAANVKAFAGIYNVGLFTAIAEQDISTYSEELVHARSEWHRKFHARGLAVLLAELMEDLPELLGKQYRRWLIEIELDDSWMQRLNGISKDVGAFRRAHEPFLLEVRNYIGAHRDHNASAQHEQLVALDPIAVFRLAGQFSGPLRELIAFYTDLIAYMGRPNVIITQLSRAQSEA